MSTGAGRRARSVLYVVEGRGILVLLSGIEANRPPGHDGGEKGERSVARNGARTRTAIMDAAQGLILQQGFAATSIDQIIERTGVTKGAFFYHFTSKSDLAHALVERYAAVDAEHLERTLDRAERLGRDPLQQVLLFVGLLQEEAGELTEPFAGCLYASYCYEAQLFDEHTFGVVRSGVRHWRERFRGKLQAVIDQHRPRLPASAEELAGMILAIFEGSFILSRILAEPQYIAEQLGQYRNYLELLFAPEASSVRAARHGESRHERREELSGTEP
jgi:TetR/AcrR family transcriptional regulator, transcriptional repressor for nem operon